MISDVGNWIGKRQVMLFTFLIETAKLVSLCSAKVSKYAALGGKKAGLSMFYFLNISATLKYGTTKTLQGFMKFIHEIFSKSK